ncbi:hypothetical protein [Maribacter sp. 2-571]|uniref:hypothetical protein n=1 Tax=Maribacter sp. 2-571 TaxID=3417569 RepID=UPI003D3267E1
MRNAKNFLITLFVVLFAACDEDETTSVALQDISAPTNVNAVFDISDDDTGTVTVTPTGTGASSFEIFFGDVENETATTASPGETISKIYGEGTFTLRIVAIGATGLKSELVRIVTISFTPPTNLAATITVSETDPFEVTVTPSADDATVFDIFFGDVEEETPTTIMAGETATKIYAETGDYTVRVVARGAGSATIELSETVTITGSDNPIVLPITFDDATVNYAFGTFNGASYEVVDNPDLSGANTEASKVGAITNSGNAFEGGAFNLGTPVDFSGTDKTIAMKLWSTSAVPVLLKFEGGVNGERENEVTVNHGGTGWEILTFDFANNAVKSFIDGSQGVGEAFVPDGQYATIVIFVDGPGTSAGTFYLDDLEQSLGAMAALELPMDFDDPDVDYAFGTFNGASYEVVDNPDLSGANTEASKVGAITNSGNAFEGGAFDLGTPVDFMTDKTISMKFWATTSVPVLLKFENGVNGERENEVVVTHGGTGWEDLTFDFANDATKSFIDGSQGVGEAFVPEGQYATMVLFVDGPGNTSGTFYVDAIVQSAPDMGAAVVRLPLDFESTTLTYNFVGFEGADSAIEANSVSGGINTSTQVMRITKTNGAQFFAGTFVDLEEAIDFSASQTLRMKTYSPKANIPIRMALENSEGGVTQIAVDVNTTVTDQWEELTFDFSGVFDADASYNRVVIFFEFIDGLAGDGSTYYFDDIALSN